MRPRPPPVISTRMRVAPASRLFSTSSLTTLAGFSITSPAAIWLMVLSERIRMVEDMCVVIIELVIFFFLLYSYRKKKRRMSG